MYKILIVEDDPMVAMINEQYIKRNKNFQIAGKCSDGKAAIDFLEKERADLIILDVYMPHMDGFETLRNIRSRKIPAEAIMVTAANDIKIFLSEYQTDALYPLPVRLSTPRTHNQRAP